MTTSGRIGLANAADSASLISADNSQSQAIMSGTTQGGFVSWVRGSTAATVNVYGFKSAPTTAASAITTTDLDAFLGGSLVKGSGSTVTRCTVFRGSISSTGASNALLTDNNSYSGNFGIHLATSNANNLGTGKTTVQTLAITGNSTAGPMITDSSGNATSEAQLAIARGGTGASTAAGARAALCVVPTVQKFTSGSGVYSTPTFPAPLYIKVTMLGGGGGGAGSATTVANNGGAGGTGGTSTFGTTLLSAGGGVGGAATSGAAGGAGGTSSLGSGPIGLALPGGTGQGSDSGIASVFLAGGMGAASAFGGAGGGGASATAGVAGATNTGGGGGGAGSPSAGYAGAGGGAGGFVSAIITAPGATFAYSVGAAGTAGSSGTSGFAGGAGGSGVILVEEFYQ